MLYGGGTKSVQNVQTGDELIGDDLEKRWVTVTARGRGALLSVSHSDGTSYVVNEEHVLSLWDSINETVVDVPAQEFAKGLRPELLGVRLYRKGGMCLTKVRVAPIGRGDYFGFEVTGDGRFLLGDGTVTHNSRISKNPDQ